ncbi:hypothetical protein ACFVTY_04645 [Streptomyces sp. NPDC058067]|uniref:hypothetical protein n=1 Tax=Streptomyces sp. NPDC058067 TaxID=3346324 RepID=UPI0036E6B512
MTVELPPEPVHFVNRDEEKERAFRAVDDWRGRSRPLVLSLNGPGGLGKTELAFLIARALRGRFPDGVLSVDLDDYRVGGSLDPGDVLGQLLGSLGVEPASLAPQFKARCRQYWNKTSDLKLIVVVDNARYASEAVPLLPASGDSLVIVASHGPLYDLEAGAAVELTLPPLAEPAATELLELIAADHRLAADPEATRAVVGLCDGLPAALHVAGRWVRRHRLRPLPRLIAELQRELDEKGLAGVEHIWDTAYKSLSAPAASLYRLLPHHPGPTFTQDSATALLGRGPDECQEALEELDRAGLLDLRAVARTDEGRMRLPGPLHTHARRRAQRDAAESEISEAQTRVLRWYVRQSQRADLFAAGRRLTVADPFPPLPDAPDVLAESADDGSGPVRARRAAHWLYEERHALFACVRLAHGRGLDTEAVALCEPVWTYALDHPHQSDVIEIFRLGVTCAVRSGNPAWMARMRCQLARPLWESGQLSEARRELDSAVSALGLLGDSERDRKLGASVTEFRGMLHSAGGDWRAAAVDFAQARETHLAISNVYGAMLQTYRLGQAHAELGDLDTAHRLLAQAHADAEAQHRERLIGRTGFALGGVLHRLGHTDRARRLYEQSLEGARLRRSGFEEARVLDALAELAEAEDLGDEADGWRVAAEAIRRRNGLA